MEKKFSWKKFWTLAATHFGTAVVAVCITLLVVTLVKDPGMRKLERLAGLIEKYHVDDPDMKAVYDQAAAGMVAGIGDRWSYYISAADMEAYNNSHANTYVGVGITVQEREDQTGIDVLYVTSGGPAQRAGILPGDVITAVDGVDTKKETVSQLVDRVAGEAGTNVVLTILRNGETIEFTVQRQVIDVIVAEGKLVNGNVGYIKINNFNEKCASETIAAIESVMGQGAECLIFDVRNNPGGYKDEMVKILDYLLPEGDLFKSVLYDGSVEIDKSDASCLRMPMAVLVNGDSYSAAEFFAAALEEYGWAIIGGEPTVGKGHMQTTFDLQDGSAVGLSIGKYYTPKGVSLADQGGLKPSVQVELSDEARVLLYSGLLEPEDDAQLQALIEEMR